MTNKIEIQNLNYKNLFKNFNISIPQNTFVSISGSNNCGKTTLVRILNQEIEIKNTIKINDINLEEIKKDKLHDFIYVIIPGEYDFQNENVEEELYSYCVDNIEQDKIKEIIKSLKLKKLLLKKTTVLNIKEIIKIQLAIACIINPKIVVIDCIDDYLLESECNDIYNFLGQFQKENNNTIIAIIRNLKYSLITEKLYILDVNNIVTEGKPITVLEKYNLINKAGINVPFMIDLCMKLKDYDLINDVKYDSKELVELLWK